MTSMAMRANALESLQSLAMAKRVPRTSRASYRSDNRSEASDPVIELDDWNSSQSNLAETEQPQAGNGSGWNILVKKTVVQTRGVGAV